MRKINFIRLLCTVFCIIAIIIIKIVNLISKTLCINIIVHSKLLLIVFVAILALIFCDILLSHRIYKGIRYFWYHFTIKNSLELQMIDAGFYIERNCYIDIPKIQLSFNNNFSAAELKIRDSLKFDKKLDDVVLSSALGKFVVERHYITDDGNYYIYELIDGSVSFKLVFNSFKEFLNYNKGIDTYKLFLDSRTAVKLQHCLLVGQTGSGKTYELYNLLLQMMNKQVKYELYFADPKGSSLAIIGSTINENRTAVSVEEIIDLLEQFVSLMRERKGELKELLKTQIDGDYSTFGLSPYVFICEEYASFASVLQSMEKKSRDKVKSLLYEIILQGRQLGFFLFLIMQKSDAALIDTALRDNMPLKIVLGNSEQQTYITTFGNGVDIPNRHYSVGEGVFTEPTIAPEPKLLQCPYCKFDILKAF